MVSYPRRLISFSSAAKTSHYLTSGILTSENYGLAVKTKFFFLIKSKYVDVGKNSGAVLSVPT